MAQILDKQGLQHYANKMCNADNRKVGSKSLPTALNDIDTAIDGFKTLFESEYGSALDMKLENNENIFSIGTGTNVDKRSEVENSFTDIELSGNTVVNLIQEKSYLDWHVLYCGRKSAEGVFIGRGQKYASQAAPNNTTSTDVRCNIISKKNSVYTLIFDAKVIEGTSSEFTIVYNGICIRNTAKIKDGRNVILIRSDDSQNGTFQIYEVTGNNNESDINIRLTNIVILEGDWTNKPIPQYFEGMKSVGQDDVNGHKIEILSQNENLFDNTKAFQGYVTSDGQLTNRTHNNIRSDYISIKPNAYYSVLCDGASSAHNYSWFDSNKVFIQRDTVGNKCISPSNAHYLIYHNAYVNDYSYVDLDSAKITLTIGQQVPTQHIVYKSNKKEISLNEPLRGLLNEIKDTIEKINGEWKIVRRCSEVVLNGSEPWTLLSDTDKEKTIGFRIKNFLPLSRYGDKYKMVICDRFPSYKHNLWKKDYEGITTENNVNDVINDTQLQIIISKSKLPSQDVEGFKQWLSQNPTKVIYQLDTSIIEDVSPVTLQCWKNGTISIDEVLPVESTHTVSLNKSAQIQKNIEELTVLRNRVKALEKQYDNSTLNQAYELELLRLDMELDNIV